MNQCNDQLKLGTEYRFYTKNNISPISAIINTKRKTSLRARKRLITE